MKRYNVAQARKHLADVLDLAERGEGIVIERRGVRFALSALREGSRPARPSVARIELIDASVESGMWTWSLTEHGASFQRLR